MNNLLARRRKTLTILVILLLVLFVINLLFVYLIHKTRNDRKEKEIKLQEDIDYRYGNSHDTDSYDDDSESDDEPNEENSPDEENEPVDESEETDSNNESDGEASVVSGVKKLALEYDRETRYGRSLRNIIYFAKEPARINRYKEPIIRAVSDPEKDIFPVDNERAEFENKVDTVLANMTLHEKVCQMFIVTPEELTGCSGYTQSGEETAKKLKEYPVAGIVYFDRNLKNKDQTVKMINNTVEYSKAVSDIPIFIAVDEEGGLVSRCANSLGTTSFKDAFDYKKDGPDSAYEHSKIIASDLKELGFNLDFAPVADTWSNPSNTVIGKRAFSNDFSETPKFVDKAVHGFHDGNVLCCLKHFPGHGDTAEDSHKGYAYSKKNLEQLEKDEFLAFKKGIDAGTDMVMVAHIIVSAVDKRPASFSEKMVTGELRGKLGYEGVIVTDSLEMGAISKNYSSKDATIACVKAGVDIILMPKNFDEAVNGLEKAVTDGEISEERIDESVRRILFLKYGKLNGK